MSYSDHFARHLRLTMLRLLHEAAEYRLNTAVITDAANAMGLVATRAQIRTELAWLAEQGAVTVVELGETVTVATLTERGADVAAGRAAIPGVQRPGPSASPKG
jgi:Fe2+ or Zn2+ uptake regulation protein